MGLNLMSYRGVEIQCGHWCGTLREDIPTIWEYQLYAFSWSMSDGERLAWIAHLCGQVDSAFHLIIICIIIARAQLLIAKRPQVKNIFQTFLCQFSSRLKRYKGPRIL